jgi:hypothetical protein
MSAGSGREGAKEPREGKEDEVPDLLASLAMVETSDEVVGDELVPEARTADELAAAPRAGLEVAAQVVEAANGHPAVAAPLVEAGPVLQLVGPQQVRRPLVVQDPDGAGARGGHLGVAVVAVRHLPIFVRGCDTDP